jgi:hypothetical protein
VSDIRLAAFVCQGVVSAPPGRDPTEVAARVFSLGEVAHVDRLLCRRGAEVSAKIDTQRCV